jgi:chromate transporter
MGEDSTTERKQGSPGEVFFTLLRLGCTSFGGPIAHLGYFRKELVERRKWCEENTLAELIAMAQSLPGPSSSQVGFALGILRAGWAGGLAAWAGFTLPSALLMLAFAYGHSLLDTRSGLLHGLQVVAVAVVAQAVTAMQRSLAPDRIRAAFAVLATGLTLFAPAQFSTLLAIAVGAVAGLLFFRADSFAGTENVSISLPKSAGIGAAAAFLVLLSLPPLVARVASLPSFEVFSAFYRSGALVFGGGHVVLPLLEGAIVAPGWVTQPSFLAGYGAAQALPGPLFSFGVYLGATIRPTPNPVLYSALGLIGIFTPGLLAMAAVLPFWSQMRGNRLIAAALKGINACVVGILIAALFRPLWTSTIHSALDFWVALLAFTLLALWKMPPWVVVVGVAAVFLIKGVV